MNEVLNTNPSKILFTMKSGVIARIEGDLNEVESFHRIRDSEGRELRESIEIRQDYTNISGDLVGQFGRAAVQRAVTSEDVEIDENGSITLTERTDTSTQYTEFLVAPEEFLIVKSRKGSFVFDLVESVAEATVEPAELDLHSFVQSQPDADPWKIGFYGKRGNADNGVIHGTSLLDDSDLREVFNKTATNQIGIEYEKDGQLYKIFATESGYVEVYQPGNFDSVEFIEFIQEELSEHIK